MKPTTKTALIVGGSIGSIFLVPTLLVIFHDYLYALIIIICFVACFVMVCYYLYIDILPVIMREQIEEEQIIASFNGDPEKIRFYKGFKKHFSGELTIEGLKKWFEHHPRKR